MQLSNAIFKAARRHRVPARIYTAILMQESSYRLGARGRHCGHPEHKGEKGVECVVSDYGIAQIHFNTVDRYNFNREKLTTDLSYSVEAGAEVLSYFERRYSEKEGDWWVRFNLGTRPKESVITKWKEYHRLVGRYL